MHSEASSSARRIRVLLVDDSAEFRAAAREYLRSLPDVTLAGEAVDGRDALAQCQRLVPDLVLMDVRMPPTNGIDATPPIKALRPAPTVVLFTVLPTAALRHAALAAGADELFAKSDFVMCADAALACLREAR